jgi:hypothetical protein
MRSRTRTIVFYAKSQPHWRRVIADTLVGGLHLSPNHFPLGWRGTRRVRFMFAEEYDSLSYLADWRDAWCASPLLDVELCNVNNLFEYRRGLKKLSDCELAVILHSAAGDNLALLQYGAHSFQSRRGTLLAFVGNEYDLMPEKIGFLKSVGADFIATQLPLPSARWLYEECVESEIVPAPAAVNPDIYAPSARVRRIDIGFRGDRYSSMFIGDTERTDLLDRFQACSGKWGLIADIQFQRLTREQWREFLCACKGTIGAESGVRCLERDDRTKRSVEQYLRQHPAAGFEEVRERFYRDRAKPVSGKAVSSRHFEAIGTQTCQILVEGHYNGILNPGEHYISVKKDFSNLDQAVEQFKDEGYRRAMVTRAYEHVMAAHTYRHRVEALLAVIERPARRRPVAANDCHDAGLQV